MWTRQWTRVGSGTRRGPRRSATRHTCACTAGARGTGARAQGCLACRLPGAVPQPAAAAPATIRRLPPHAHATASFDDLAGRFEAPDSRNRWDAPLFRLSPACEHALHCRMAGVCGRCRRPDRLGPDPMSARARPRAAAGPASCDDVLAAVAGVMAGSAPAPGAAAGAAAATGGALQPTPATSNPGLLGTNVLHEIDNATQARGAGAGRWCCGCVRCRARPAPGAVGPVPARWA